jgi:uncharacterized protein (UPF0212 family)
MTDPCIHGPGVADCGHPDCVGHRAYAAGTPAVSAISRAADDLKRQSTTGTYSDPCGECGIPGTFLDAVAAWLDACALVVTVSPATVKAHAERVARAYLGAAA